MPKNPRPAADPGTAPAKEQAKGTSANERVSKTTAPKPRQDVGLAWLVLLGMIMLGALPLLIDLNRPVVWSQAEALSIAVSAETHQRKTPMSQGETSLQKWTPVYEGASRWDLPPGSYWLAQVMYFGMPANGIADDATNDKALITRARMGSVLMALLFIAAVYWAGHSIGGVTTGALSALAAMTMPLLIGFGRHATPDSAAIALATLSIAGALWAMRPLRATPNLVRQLIGWLVSGIALGLATLTAGPSAIPTTLLCTIALAMVCPRRIGHVMGLLTSSAIAALLVTPWVLHAHDHDPNIWQQWVAQLTPDWGGVGILEVIRRAGWRLSLSATLCGLWLVWLIPAVSQPFSTSTGKARRKMLLGWVWLATANVLLAFAPGDTNLAGLLIAVAPASICIGLVMQQFHDLSSEARHARLWLICKWITAGLMLTLSIALPTLGYLLNEKPELVAWLPSIDHPLLAPMHWTFFFGGGLAMLLASVLAVRFALANFPGRSAACLALWLIVTYTLAAIPLTRGNMLNTSAQTPISERATTDTPSP